MKECLMVHRVGRMILSEGVTSPGLDNWQLTIGKNPNVSNGNKYSFSFCIGQLHEVYTIFHVCYNLSYPVNKKQKHMLIVIYITTVPLSRVVSSVSLLMYNLITVPISYSCHE